MQRQSTKQIFESYRNRKNLRFVQAYLLKPAYVSKFLQKIIAKTN